MALDDLKSKLASAEAQYTQAANRLLGASPETRGELLRAVDDAGQQLDVARSRLIEAESRAPTGDRPSDEKEAVGSIGGVPMQREVTASQEATQRDFAKQEKGMSEAEKEKDMNDAARLYEGLPQHRGISRSEYIQRERDWSAHLEQRPEHRKHLAELARTAYIAERNGVAGMGGVPQHREAKPGEEVTGKIVGTRTFEGVKHVVIEAGQPKERIVCQGEIKGAEIGKTVTIRLDARGAIQPERSQPDKSRAPTRNR